MIVEAEQVAPAGIPNFPDDTTCGIWWSIRRSHEWFHEAICSIWLGASASDVEFEQSSVQALNLLERLSSDSLEITIHADCRIPLHRGFALRAWPKVWSSLSSLY